MRRRRRLSAPPSRAPKNSPPKVSAAKSDRDGSQTFASRIPETCLPFVRVSAQEGEVISAIEARRAERKLKSEGVNNVSSCFDKLSMRILLLTLSLSKGEEQSGFSRTKRSSGPFERRTPEA